MAKQIKVRWTEPAEFDLKTILGFIRQQSPQAAINLIKKIRHNVSLLTEFPEMEKSYNLVQPPAREIIVGHYRIFYDDLSNENTILILAVFDSRRDPAKIFSFIQRTPGLLDAKSPPQLSHFQTSRKW